MLCTEWNPQSRILQGLSPPDGYRYIPLLPAGRIPVVFNCKLQRVGHALKAFQPQKVLGSSRNVKDYPKVHLALSYAWPILSPWLCSADDNWSCKRQHPSGPGTIVQGHHCGTQQGVPAERHPGAQAQQRLEEPHLQGCCQRPGK